MTQHSDYRNLRNAEWVAAHTDDAVKLCKQLLDIKDSLETEVDEIKGRLSVETKRRNVLLEENNKLRNQEAALHAQMVVSDEHAVNTQMLLQKIDRLKKEKERLLLQVEEEEEYLTNTLQRKLEKVSEEKHQLERQLREGKHSMDPRVQSIQKLQQKVEELENEITKLRQRRSLTTNHVDFVPDLDYGRLYDTLEQRIGALMNRREHDSGELGSADVMADNVRGEFTDLRELLEENRLEQQRRLDEYADAMASLRDENLHLRQRVFREMEIIRALTKDRCTMESDSEVDSEYAFNSMRRRTTSQSSSTHVPAPSSVPTSAGKLTTRDTSQTMMISSEASTPSVTSFNMQTSNAAKSVQSTPSIPASPKHVSMQMHDLNLGTSYPRTPHGVLPPPRNRSPGPTEVPPAQYLLSRDNTC
eukprot:Clim_evm14s210 gene=Clim_evmTU14s210